MPQLVNQAELDARLGVLAVSEESSVTVELDDVWFNKRVDQEQWDTGYLTYTLELKNDGDPTTEPPAVDLTEITITDVIDVTIATLVEGSVVFTPAGSGTMVSFDPLTGRLTLSVNDVPAGESVIITFQVERVL